MTLQSRRPRAPTALTSSCDERSAAAGGAQRARRDLRTTPAARCITDAVRRQPHRRPDRLAPGSRLARAALGSDRVRRAAPTAPTGAELGIDYYYTASARRLKRLDAIVQWRRTSSCTTRARATTPLGRRANLRDDGARWSNKARPARRTISGKDEQIAGNSEMIDALVCFAVGGDAVRRGADGSRTCGPSSPWTEQAVLGRRAVPSTTLARKRARPRRGGRRRMLSLLATVTRGRRDGRPTSTATAPATRRRGGDRRGAGSMGTQQLADSRQRERELLAIAHALRECGSLAAVAAVFQQKLASVLLNRRSSATASSSRKVGRSVTARAVLAIGGDELVPACRAPKAATRTSRRRRRRRRQFAAARREWCGCVDPAIDAGCRPHGTCARLHRGHHCGRGCAMGARDRGPAERVRRQLQGVGQPRHGGCAPTRLQAVPRLARDSAMGTGWVISGWIDDVPDPRWGHFAVTLHDARSSATLPRTTPRDGAVGDAQSMTIADPTASACGVETMAAFLPAVHPPAGAPIGRRYARRPSQRDGGSADVDRAHRRQPPLPTKILANTLNELVAKTTYMNSVFGVTVESVGTVTLADYSPPPSPPPFPPAARPTSRAAAAAAAYSYAAAAANSRHSADRPPPQLPQRPRPPPPSRRRAARRHPPAGCAADGNDDLCSPFATATWSSALSEFYMYLYDETADGKDLKMWEWPRVAARRRLLQGQRLLRGRAARRERVHPAGRVLHRLWRSPLRQHVRQPLDRPDLRLRQGGARAVRRGLGLRRLRPQRATPRTAGSCSRRPPSARGCHRSRTRTQWRASSAPSSWPRRTAPAAAVPGRAAAR